MKKVAVRFKNQYGEFSKEYHYVTSISNLKQGDIVIVESKDFYGVAVFEEYVSNDVKASKFVIQKLDISEIERDKDLARKIDEVKRKIDERVRELTYINNLKNLAKEDTTLNYLVETLESLNSTEKVNEVVRNAK